MYVEAPAGGHAVSDEPLSVTVKLQRGDTDNRDTLKATVDAETIDELDEKVGQIREKMDSWADQFREIQPTNERTRELLDGQQELVEADP
jgi:hypothetical protein